ncbi:MAG: GatB/YqeY domain-containing protein [Verrucomicrobiota bacterium]|jgi:uncharacterized protein YqeY
MSNISDQIMHDLKEAMRNKDQTAMTTLRALKSALKYAAIEKLGADGELPDSDAIGVVRKQIKQRRDSIEQFTSGGRSDLADKEAAEIAVLARFLPTALSPEETEALVSTVISELGATSRQQMGQVMKVLQERAAGRADGKVLSQLVAKHLS